MRFSALLHAPTALKSFMAFVLIGTFGMTSSLQPSSPTKDDTPFAVEYYYKVKWGHQGEFLDLYKKNHYPILVKLQEIGRIVEMRADRPFNHASESARWDFRYTIVWKNAAIAHEDFDTSAILAELYPDQETFEQEEQRRFQLLLEHTDIPVVPYDLETW